MARHQYFTPKLYRLYNLTGFCNLHQHNIINDSNREFLVSVTESTTYIVFFFKKTNQKTVDKTDWLQNRQWHKN